MSFISILAIITFMVVLIVFGYKYITGRQAAEAYQKSPLCISIDQNGDCRRIAPAVVRQIYERFGRSRSDGKPTGRFAEIQTDGGETIEAKIPERDFWEKLKTGTPVTVEIWRGEIMSIQMGGTMQVTSANPVSDTQDNLTIGLILLIVFGLATIFTVGLTILTIFVR